MSDTAELKLDNGIVMQLGKKLYDQNFTLVIIRELMQNALDANAKTIHITYTDKKIEFHDNGTGMSKSCMLNEFLTVGGSNKDRSATTVGGFGIAKLAIMSCKNWQISSGRCYLDKDILINNRTIEEIDFVLGTRVIVEDDEFSWGERTIRDYVSMISADVNVYLNGDEIKSLGVKEIFIGNRAVKIFDDKSTSHSQGVFVRCNGLPLFAEYISIIPQGTLVFYDTTTQVMPYEEGYPFTATRESFVESPEKEDYSLFYKEITNFYSEKMKLEEVERTNLHFEAPFWLCGDAKLNPLFNDIYKKKLDVFSRFIRILGEKKGELTEAYEFGFCGDKIGAAYMKHPLTDSNIFLVNPDPEITKYVLMMYAAHEFAHTASRQHGERFCEELEKNILYLMKIEGMN